MYDKLIQNWTYFTVNMNTWVLILFLEQPIIMAWSSYGILKLMNKSNRIQYINGMQGCNRKNSWICLHTSEGSVPCILSPKDHDHRLSAKRSACSYAGFVEVRSISDSISKSLIIFSFTADVHTKTWKWRCWTQLPADKTLIFSSYPLC